jgi:hypothetical protein
VTFYGGGAGPSQKPTRLQASMPSDLKHGRLCISRPVDKDGSRRYAGVPTRGCRCAACMLVCCQSMAPGHPPEARSGLACRRC